MPETKNGTSEVIILLEYLPPKVNIVSMLLNEEVVVVVVTLFSSSTIVLICDPIILMEGK